MAGVVRIVFGVLFLLAGLALLATIIFFLFGLIGIILGVILLASGASARADEQRMLRQQQQTNLLLQQQMQLSAMQANRPVYPPAYTPQPVVSAPPPDPTGPPSPLASAAAERYCPSCGGGNSRTAAFCQKCGKPLPPPP